MSERDRSRKAEILSTSGAAIAGAGGALLLERWLSSVALPLLVVGVLAHGIGMLLRRRLELRDLVQRAAWEEPVYWLCWLILAGILAYGFMRT